MKRTLTFNHLTVYVELPKGAYTGPALYGSISLTPQPVAATITGDTLAAVIARANTAKGSRCVVAESGSGPARLYLASDHLAPLVELIDGGLVDRLPTMPEADANLLLHKLFIIACLMRDMHGIEQSIKAALRDYPAPSVAALLHQVIDEHAATYAITSQ